MIKYFDFETQIESIDKEILLADESEKNYNISIDALTNSKNKKLKKIYDNLTPWQKVQVARHNERPHTLDYVNNIFTEIVFLHGDKKFSDDKAVVGGFAKFFDKSVVFIGTEKGNSVESRIRHNFGMAKPEGYRKAQRLMLLAEKFNLPVRAGGWFYQIGDHRKLLEQNLKIGKELGSLVHNTQIQAYKKNGQLASDEDIRNIYLEAYDLGLKYGVTPCFEIHVNMWTKYFWQIPLKKKKIM